MNWTKMISMNRDAVVRFANGTLPKNDFYATFSNTELGGSVRSFLREKGAKKARSLAKNALSRRGLK